MDRERSLVWCVPALLTAGTLTLAANADDHDTQRTAQGAADRESGDVADEMQDARQQVRDATNVGSR